MHLNSFNLVIRSKLQIQIFLNSRKKDKGLFVFWVMNILSLEKNWKQKVVDRDRTKRKKGKKERIKRKDKKKGEKRKAEDWKIQIFVGLGRVSRTIEKVWSKNAHARPFAAEGIMGEILQSHSPL